MNQEHPATRACRRPCASWRLCSARRHSVSVVPFTPVTRPVFSPTACRAEAFVFRQRLVDRRTL
jgi:hypothetical protein